MHSMITRLLIDEVPIALSFLLVSATNSFLLYTDSDSVRSVLQIQKVFLAELQLLDIVSYFALQITPIVWIPRSLI